MVEIEKLKKKYMTVTAVENITMNIEAGRIYALLGPNGSGKTTLMKMIAGLTKQTAGTILYEGAPIGVEVKEAYRIYADRELFLFIYELY